MQCPSIPTRHDTMIASHSSSNVLAHAERRVAHFTPRAEKFSNLNRVAAAKRCGPERLMLAYIA